MHALKCLGLGVLVVLGLAAVPVWADEEAAEPKDLPPWAARRDGNLRSLFHQMSQPPARVPRDRRPIPLTKSTKKADKPAVEDKAELVKQTARDEAAAERAREEATLLRRLAVCTRLMQVAEQNNDKELLRMAEQLDERAWRNYSERTALLSSASGGESESRLPSRSAAEKKELEELEKSGSSAAKEEKP